MYAPAMRLPAMRQSTSPEARAAASPWRRLTSLLVLALIAVGALLVGMAVAEGRLGIALLSTASLVGLAAFRYLGLPAWCALLLITSVAARGPRDALGLPAVVDFMHYAVTLGFALAALDRSPRAASRAPGRWIAGLVLVVSLSAVAHPGNPLRGLFFLLIMGEPLVVIWAISRWGADEETLRSVGIVAALLAVIQLPIAVYQGMNYGWTDPVQGTLVGHGAGSHVLGALFALGLLIVVAAILTQRVSPVIGALGAAVCLGMMIATGSVAVIIIAAIAAMLEPLLVGPRRGEGIQLRRLSSLLIALILGLSVLVIVSAWVPGIYERVASLTTTREPPEMQIIRSRASSDPLALLLGSGPGTSASRASLLLTGPQADSPVEFLGLEPTELGRKIAAAVALSNEQFGGSAESAASSALGVVGDLGLVGLAALGTLFLAIWRGAGRSRSWLAPAARAGLLMVAALSLVDNWLEYPEFTVPFAVLIGFVMSDASASPGSGLTGPR